MKRCDRCQNEASFFWRISVNGQTREVALCQDCAACEKQTEDLSLFDLPAFDTLPFFARRTKQNEPTLAAANETPEKPLPTLQTQTEKTLPTLKAELKRALRREDYLAAARLRDSIRAIEGK